MQGFYDARDRFKAEEERDRQFEEQKKMSRLTRMQLMNALAQSDMDEKTILSIAGDDQQAVEMLRAQVAQKTKAQATQDMFDRMRGMEMHDKIGQTIGNWIDSAVDNGVYDTDMLVQTGSQLFGNGDQKSAELAQNIIRQRLQGIGDVRKYGQKRYRDKFYDDYATKYSKMPFDLQLTAIKEAYPSQADEFATYATREHTKSWLRDNQNLVNAAAMMNDEDAYKFIADSAKAFGGEVDQSVLQPYLTASRALMNRQETDRWAQSAAALAPETLKKTQDIIDSQASKITPYINSEVLEANGVSTVATQGLLGLATQNYITSPSVIDGLVRYVAENKSVFKKMMTPNEAIQLLTAEVSRGNIPGVTPKDIKSFDDVKSEVEGTMTSTLGVKPDSWAEYDKGRYTPLLSVDPREKLEAAFPPSALNRPQDEIDANWTRSIQQMRASVVKAKAELEQILIKPGLYQIYSKADSDAVRAKIEQAEQMLRQISLIQKTVPAPRSTVKGDEHDVTVHPELDPFKQPAPSPQSAAGLSQIKEEMKLIEREYLNGRNIRPMPKDVADRYKMLKQNLQAARSQANSTLQQQSSQYKKDHPAIYIPERE